MDPSTPLPVGADIVWGIVAVALTVAVILVVWFALRRGRSSR